MNGIVAILTDQQTWRSLGADDGADIIAIERVTGGHYTVKLYWSWPPQIMFSSITNLYSPRSITLASLWPKSWAAVIFTSISLPPPRSLTYNLTLQNLSERFGLPKGQVRY